MDIYVARQPIFDRDMNVFGYELLYRKSMNNFYEGTDDTQSTAELINNSIFSLNFNELTEGKRAFINFSEELLFQEIPFLLPKETITIEILERVENSEKLLQVCKKLKEKGYMTALDDFVFQESFVPIINEVNIIKIEYPTVDLTTQKDLIKRFHKKIKFLAEKVETREEYQKALELGYDYFQGYFFSKPLILKGKDLPSMNANLVHIVYELRKDDLDYQKIAEIIEMDLGLSYKLLRLANSIFFGAHSTIHSIKSALVRLGIEEIRKWIYLMILKDIQQIENKELIKTSLIRAKMMELLAKGSGKKNKHMEYFMAGLFSSMDILLNRDMIDIVGDLALADDVKEALLGINNEVRKFLTCVCDFEKADWDNFDKNLESLGLEKKLFTEKYMEAVHWIAKIEIV